MATLRELFAKLYAYVLLFEQEDFQHTVSPSCAQLHEEIVSWVERQKAEARRHDLDTDNQQAPFQEALFAFVAWADETLGKHATWEQRNRWPEAQLQLKYFQTTSAGDELFNEHLPHVAQQEVREIYYLSLGLGFKGRYYRGRPEDERRLAHDRHSLAQGLAVENAQRLDKLTPQPYQVQSPPRQEIKPPLTRLLLKVVLALLLIIPLAFLVYYWLQPELPPVQLQVMLAGNGRGMVSSIPEGLRCAPTCVRDFPKGTVVTLQAVQEPGSTFAGWSGETDCAARGFTLRSAKKCTATFTLAVTPVPPSEDKPMPLCATMRISEAQRAELRRLLQSVQEDLRMQDLPRPFCQVIELLEPFKKYSESQAFGLTIYLNKGGERPLYLRGDELVVNGQAPKTFKSYLYIDHYAADGKGVGHLLPNKEESVNFFMPNTLYTAGGPSGLQWLTSTPFGLEMITAIASKTPLFEARRPTSAAVDTYLPALRQALQKVAPSDAAVTFFFIRTQDQ